MSDNITIESEYERGFTEGRGFAERTDHSAYKFGVGFRAGFAEATEEVQKFCNEHIALLPRECCAQELRGVIDFLMTLESEDV